jgi:hypothetical protein
VQVDAFKPTLKAPEIKLLKLKSGKPLSKFSFKFNLRRYSWARWRSWTLNNKQLSSWYGGAG